jgi:hypothetical protein
MLQPHTPYTFAQPRNVTIDSPQPRTHHHNAPSLPPGGTSLHQQLTHHHHPADLFTCKGIKVIFLIPPKPGATASQAFASTVRQGLASLAPGDLLASSPLVQEVVAQGGVVFELYEGWGVRIASGAWHAVYNLTKACR